MPYHLVAFPVKPRHVIANNMSTNIVKHQRWNFGTGSKVPGWAAVADMGLIEKSSKELMQLIQMNQWQRVLLPRPGCGAGELQYDEVKEVIAPILAIALLLCQSKGVNVITRTKDITTRLKHIVVNDRLRSMQPRPIEQH